MSEQHESKRTEWGNIDAWRRADSTFGVSLLPDEGHPDYPGHTYTSHESPDGFPPSYDAQALIEWGERQWKETP